MSDTAGAHATSGAAQGKETIDRRGLLAGGAALAGAAAGALAGAQGAKASHGAAVLYDPETVMHVDETNTTTGSTRISSNVSGTAAFVGLNNYPVGISRPDGILGRTTYATANCAGVAGSCEATSGGIGVLGASNAATGTGVYGFSGSSVPSEVAPGGTGVFGRGPSRGVLGRSTAGPGVRGESTSAAGVEGQSTSGTGVSGTTASGVAVLGTAGAGGLAGRFVGTTNVEGALNASGALSVGGQASVGALQVAGASTLGASASADRLVLPKTSGIATLRRAAASITVSNVAVAKGALALATLQTRRSGLYITAAVPSVRRRRITIYFNKKAPRNTKVAWMLVN